MSEASRIALIETGWWTFMALALWLTTMKVLRQWFVVWAKSYFDFHSNGKAGFDV